MGKWPPVGVSSPLTSRVWSRASREHAFVTPTMHPGEFDVKSWPGIWKIEQNSNTNSRSLPGVVVESSMESSSCRVYFGAIGVEMGKWPPVGVSSPLASRVWSRAFREHACGAYDAPWGVLM